MASAFRRHGSAHFTASFRAWDAKAGRWRWQQKPTGVADKAAAMGIAAMLEAASGAAKAGGMTRERASALVDDILRLAGLDAVGPVPSVESVMAAMMKGADVAASTADKYRAQSEAFAEWAGARLKEPVSAWQAADVERYYLAARKLYSTTTANDHLRFVRMLFAYAVRMGHIATNPADAVRAARNDSAEKAVFERPHIAKLYRAFRAAKRADWCALLALGWHTGHRIQDLLSVTGSRIRGDLLTLNPAKKQGRGREVVLPIPGWLAKLVVRLGGFGTIYGGSNRSGKASNEFIEWLRLAGIDPLPVKRGPRTIHRRSFHSLRHSMASRLAAAGVSGELARLVTDHDSPKIQRRYVHAEIQALREALRAARGR